MFIGNTIPDLSGMQRNEIQAGINELSNVYWADQLAGSHCELDAWAIIMLSLISNYLDNGSASQLALFS